MGALRNHGWVISSEEQDTHELFHALTSTIDDEIANAFATPSLLDVVWLEDRNLNLSEDGILLKAASWKNGLEIGSLNSNNETHEHFDEINVGQTDRGASARKAGEETNLSTNNGNGDINETCNTGVDKDELKDNRSDSTNNHSCDEKTLDLDKICGNDDSGMQTHILQNGKISDESETKQNNHDTDKVNKFKSVMDDCAVNTNKNNSIKSKLESGKHSKQRPDINIRPEDSEKYWKTRPDQQDSPFRGYLASQLQCILCGHKNPAQWASFESLSLSLPSLPWGEVTLQELLDTYITQEKVTEVTCDSCTKRAGTNVKTSFTKQLTIGKLPECLCFHIKRTIWLDNGTAVKRRDHVSFPEFLIMDPYTYTTSITTQQSVQSCLYGGCNENIRGSSMERDWPTHMVQQTPSSILSQHATSSQLEASPFIHVSRVRCDQLYRLKAVIVHVGDVFCGHFVTYRRGPIGSRTRNRWFYTSDLLVREATLEEVRKANAYMILYEKVTQ